MKKNLIRKVDAPARLANTEHYHNGIRSIHLKIDMVLLYEECAISFYE